MENPEFQENLGELATANNSVILDSKSTKNKRKSKKKKSGDCITTENALLLESNDFPIIEQSVANPTSSESQPDDNNCEMDKNAKDLICQGDINKQDNESSKKKKKRKQRKRKSKNLMLSEDTVPQECDDLNGDNKVIIDECNQQNDGDSATVDGEHSSSVSVASVSGLEESDVLTAYENKQISKDLASYKIDADSACDIAHEQTNDFSSSMKKEENQSLTETNKYEIKDDIPIHSGSEQIEIHTIPHDTKKQGINSPQRENASVINLTPEQASYDFKKTEKQSEPETNDIEIKDDIQMLSKSEQNYINLFTHEFNKQGISDPQSDNANVNNLSSHEQTSDTSSSFKTVKNRSEPETSDHEIKNDISILSEQNEINKLSVDDSRTCEDKQHEDDEPRSNENNSCDLTFNNISDQEYKNSNSINNLDIVRVKEEGDNRKIDENKQIGEYSAVYNISEQIVNCGEEVFCVPTSYEIKKDNSHLIICDSKIQYGEELVFEEIEQKNQDQKVINIVEDEYKSVMITESKYLIISSTDAEFTKLKINNKNEKHDDAISNESENIGNLVTYKISEQNINFCDPISYESNNQNCDGQLTIENKDDVCDPITCETQEQYGDETVTDKNEHKSVSVHREQKNAIVAVNSGLTSETNELPADSIANENNQIRENSEHETCEENGESMQFEVDNQNYNSQVTYERNKQGGSVPEANDREQEDSAQASLNIPEIHEWNIKDDPKNLEKSKKEDSPIYEQIHPQECNISVTCCNVELSEQNQTSVDIESHNDDVIKASDIDKQNSEDSLTKEQNNDNVVTREYLEQNNGDSVCSGNEEQKVEDGVIPAQDELSDSDDKKPIMDLSFTWNASSQNSMSSSSVHHKVNQKRSKIQQSSLKRSSSSRELMPLKRRKNEVIPASKGFFVTLAAIPVSFFLLACHCVCALFSIFKR